MSSPAAPAGGGGGGRPAAWLFAALALFYALSTGGHVYSPDAVVMGRVTEGLVERGDLAVDGRRFPPGFLAAGRDGRSYAKYGVGLSVAAVPFYLLGRGLAAVASEASAEVFAGPTFLWYAPGNPRDAWAFFGLSLTNAAVVAGLCALLFAFARRLGYRPRTALAAALLAAFASPLWVYAKSFFAEPLAALALVAFAFFAEGSRAGRSPGPPLAAGLALGAAILTKPALAVLVPAAVGVLAYLLAAGRGRRGAAVAMGAFAAGLGAMVGILGAVNLVRFGSPLATGYGAELGYWSTPAAVGLAGLLVSPGRGLLTHFPLVGLAAACTPAAYRRHPAWVIFSWAVLATLLVFYCRWHGWDGGWCWGPRFLIPAVPFLVLLTAPFFAAPPRRTGWRVAAWALVTASALIAFSGTLVPYTEFHQALRRTFGGALYLEVARWSWAAYPPLAYALFEPKSYYLLPRLLAAPSTWWLAGPSGFAAVLWLPLAAAARRRALGQPGRSRPLPWLAAALAAGLLAAAAPFLLRVLAGG